MPSITVDKSKAFAIRIVKLYKWLTKEKGEYVISKQLLRSGTSVGANLAESQGCGSKADFINKLHISLKECKESLYWLDLLVSTDYLTQKEFESLTNDAREIEKLLTASLRTSKASLLNW